MVPVGVLDGVQLFAHPSVRGVPSCAEPRADKVAPVLDAAQHVVQRAMELSRVVDGLDADGWPTAEDSDRPPELLAALAAYRHERDALLVALFRRESAEQVSS